MSVTMSDLTLYLRQRLDWSGIPWVDDSKEDNCGIFTEMTIIDNHVIAQRGYHTVMYPGKFATSFVTSPKYIHGFETVSNILENAKMYRQKKMEEGNKPMITSSNIIYADEPAWRFLTSNDTDTVSTFWTQSLKPILRHRFVKKVYFNNPYTIVIWVDGGKTIVKCAEDQTYDPYTGLVTCYLKRVLGDEQYSIVRKQIRETLNDNFATLSDFEFEKEKL